MAEFEVTWLERKPPSKSGKMRLEASLLNNAGKEVEVTIWEDFPGFSTIQPGSVLEGHIKEAKDPKYKPSLVSEDSPAPRRTRTTTTPTNTKYEAPKEGNRDNAIKLSGSQRDAVLLVTTFYPDVAELPQIEREANIKSLIKEWRKFLWDNFEKPLNDEPPF